ncbi:MAG: aminoglycoside adenylyltransferase domain-containing protein [Nocardioides sp.]|jgi:hypothetical protein
MILQELDQQLDADEAALLRAALADLTERIHRILGADLAGVYLTGSFALGAGDVHADVDFLVATTRSLSAAQEQAVRELHAVLPDRDEHWAHNLEGSYASLDDLRKRADPSTLWLYVDNGNRAMEWSAHDNTEVFRWVLRNRALTIQGLPVAELVGEVPAQVLRTESVRMAATRLQDIADDPRYLRNAWAQPHEVLTRCRLLVTATLAEVVGKAEAGRWCQTVLPDEWHDLIDQAIADRPDPWQRVHRATDPALTTRTWEFVQFVTPLIASAASNPGPESSR